MNLFNYFFYRIYKSTSKVNDLFPEIATIIFLSALIFINIASILLLLNVSIEKFGLNGIYLIITIILGFNFFYFLKDDNYKIIIDKYDLRKRYSFIDILIFLHPFISVFIFFKLLEMTNAQICFTLLVLLLVEIYAYFNEKSHE